MTQFTKSFLWRFILDIILLGIFVRLLQSVILAILSRSMETYDDVDYVYDKYALKLSISLDTFFSKILTKQQIIQHRTSAVSLPVEVRR